MNDLYSMTYRQLVDEAKALKERYRAIMAELHKREEEAGRLYEERPLYFQEV